MGHDGVRIAHYEYYRYSGLASTCTLSTGLPFQVISSSSVIPYFFGNDFQPASQYLPLPLPPGQLLKSQTAASAYTHVTLSGFLIDQLNRPLRVCGVVPNTGEPGGGPFWVRGRDGSSELQIVESAEVDPDDHPCGLLS